MSITLFLIIVMGCNDPELIGKPGLDISSFDTIP